jgi:hypothetical protein
MKLQLTDVRGIGPSTARALEAQGVRTVEVLAKASADKVVATRGFGEARAAEVIAAANALLAAAGVPSQSTASAGATKTKIKQEKKGTKKKGKNKKKKKDKKSKKKK